MYKAQGIIADSEKGDIEKWLDAFLLERRIRHVTPGSLRWYRQKLGPFVDWCQGEGLVNLLGLTPHHLRLFFLHLEERGNNEDGRHGFYRAIRAYLNFFEDEVEPEGWRNSIQKVSPPKVPELFLEPAPVGDIAKLIRTCDRSSFYGTRDRAIFMTLLDTGIRTMELASIDIGDLNLIDGSIQIQKGKGGKVRMVLVGKKTKKALRMWLKERPSGAGPLFTSKNGDRLTYGGLRSMLLRRSHRARVSGVTLHDFRRSFCLNQLQAGVPETVIARLMGHSNTQLIARYARQSKRDLIEVYVSVVDSEL